LLLANAEESAVGSTSASASRFASSLRFDSARDYFTASSIQRKPTVSSPDDPSEHEADDVADKVMRMIEPTSIGAAPAAIQRECAGCQEEEEETIQTQSAPSLIARRPAPGVTTRPIALPGSGERAEEDVPLGQTAIFRKAEFAAPQSNAESASPLTDRLASSQAGGEPLPALTRQRMENAFGYDFSRVRVHRDAEAGEISQRLSAHAFTHGGHIYFSNGMRPLSA